jgi:mannosyl-3-phosphoglycerate phosphatase
VRLIFTDLDGTLIDHHTYSADAARPALEAARLGGAPIVPCSSKTLAEMRTLATRLSLAPAPLIVENGSAIWFPDTWPVVPDGATSEASGGLMLVLGTPVDALRSRLEPVAAEAGVEVRGFSRMTDAEVAERTGLSLAAAALASQRQYSEPFVCLSGSVDLARLDAAARAVGARVTRGGRFFHLTGATDKGDAVRIARDTCAACTRTLGLGDAPNDLPLLRVVDDAAIIPQLERGLHPDLVAALPAALHAAAPGPVGWNAIVLAWLDRTAALP